VVGDRQDNAPPAPGPRGSAHPKDWDDPGVPGSFATEPRAVAEQAGMIAAAWSPPGAPASWRLTAEQFATLAQDEELVAIAATIPADRLPPLLFQAAATYLILELEPEPLRSWFPRVGQAQPELGSGFRPDYRAFCLEHRERLLELCAEHRYQMNEVGRCADLIPALSPAIADGRELVLVDIGTGAGLALHLDRYRYVYRAGGRAATMVGDPASPVLIETDVRGKERPPVGEALPRIAERIGIDIEPLDLTDPAVRGWLAACIPQEAGAVDRFHHAVDVALANPSRTVRGDACEVLPDVLAGIPDGALVCLIDTYVHVFFADEELARFRELVERSGADRDLDWISIDPLIPMGAAATGSVLGIDVPAAIMERNRREGVFGVIGRLGYRDAVRSGALLGLAHPGAAWLEWL
jgi:hypothetical protein